MTPTELEAIVTDAFSYLISSFGFHYVTTGVHGPECWSTFYNETTGVTVHYEYGSLPWVELTELKRHGNQIVERNRAALEFLIQERAPQEASLPSSGADMDVKRVIYEKARQLNEYGKDILGGDFRVFVRLNELARRNLQRRNATES